MWILLPSTSVPVTKRVRELSYWLRYYRLRCSFFIVQNEVNCPLITKDFNMTTYLFKTRNNKNESSCINISFLTSNFLTVSFRQTIFRLLEVHGFFWVYIVSSLNQMISSTFLVSGSLNILYIVKSFSFNQTCN